MLSEVFTTEVLLFKSKARNTSTRSPSKCNIKIQIFNQLKGVLFSDDFKNLNNTPKCTKKAKLHLQNVSIKYHFQNPHDGCQLSGKQIFFIELLTKKLFQL